MKKLLITLLMLNTTFVFGYSRSCFLDFTSSMTVTEAQKYCTNVSGSCYDNFKRKVSRIESRDKCYNVSALCFEYSLGFYSITDSRDFCYNVHNNCFYRSIRQGQSISLSRNLCLDYSPLPY